MAESKMSLAWQQDDAFNELKRQSDVVSGAKDCNESDTRLRAIDTILFEVLKWDKTAVLTEKYCRDVGYADYGFLQGTSLCLILEAKKDGATFVLPERQLSDRPIGFGLLESECREAGTALRQAAAYAASEGARYVAISNGSQWILALAFVQGQRRSGHRHHRPSLSCRWWLQKSPTLSVNLLYAVGRRRRR